MVILDRRTSCNPNPCQNHAHCLTSDGTDSFECVCHRGTSGKLCQGKFFESLRNKTRNYIIILTQSFGDSLNYSRFQIILIQNI